jgi:hypothetical protein
MPFKLHTEALVQHACTRMDISAYNVITRIKTGLNNILNDLVVTVFWSPI